MRKNGKYLHCQLCHKVVYIPKYRWNNFKFCSNSCKGKATIGTKEVQSRIKHPGGNKHPRYKGGSIHTTTGYKVVYYNGKQRFEHRVVMERYLGRKLLSAEHVHHLNHVRTDNRIENLELMGSASEHTKKYHTGELNRL